MQAPCDDPSDISYYTVACPVTSDVSQLFANLRTVARQALLSMGFSRPEYWSGFPCPPPGGLPNPGTEPTSLNVSCIGKRVLYH